MKKYTIIAIIGVLVAIAGYFALGSNTVTYVASEPVVVEKEIEVDPLAAQIKKRNEELEELYRKAQNLEASIDVREAEIERLKALNVADQKELANFIQAIASKE
jgi:peptidoglycan hydrolase CwlO-like protein